jgi:dCTP deaminase
MSIRPDHWIASKARDGMIDPFEESLVGEGTISYGVSSYGYDFRVDRRYKLLQKGSVSILDPKQASERCYRDYEGDSCLIPARSFVLCRSYEYFRIPRNVLGVCVGKSTYARCGVSVNVTPLEPEWEGRLTMSVINNGPVPVKIYSGEGIAQLLFLRARDVCRVSYSDRKGKYQAHQEITLSRLQAGRDLA